MNNDQKMILRAALKRIRAMAEGMTRQSFQDAADDIMGECGHLLAMLEYAPSARQTYDKHGDPLDRNAR